MAIEVNSYKHTRYAIKVGRSGSKRRMLCLLGCAVTCNELPLNCSVFWAVEERTVT
jgi:hypothetical protein